MSHATCHDCHALSFYYGHRSGCPRGAEEAMEAELSRVTYTTVLERMHEHLKQDMYRRAVLPRHLLGSGRVRLPTGPLTQLDDRPDDHHVQALKYEITSWRAKKHADERPVCADCMCEDGHDAGCRFAPKPPTLRAWLGDRVSELGPWADVLREQPVPAGWVKDWEWDAAFECWRAHGMTGHGEKSFTVEQIDIVSAVHGDRVAAHDAYLMALFTRHPDVKPEPAPLRTWFGNEESE